MTPTDVHITVPEYERITALRYWMNMDYKLVSETKARNRMIDMVFRAIIFRAPQMPSEHMRRRFREVRDEINSMPNPVKLLRGDSHEQLVQFLETEDE